MTPHNREVVIAAAKEAGADFKCETLIVNGKDADEFITNFYAIAFEAGRQAEREACAAMCEDGEPTSFDGYGIQLAIAIRARGDTK